MYKSTQKHYGTQGQESIHKPLYDKMHEKLTKNKAYHRRLVKRRSATVEPVLGTLINFFNLKRINSRGMAQANKHVLMSSLSYNLKKYLRFIFKIPSVLAQVVSLKQGKYSFLQKYSFTT
ncbi:transposase [Empedobacter sp. 225-1]|uniref:transposase n=1 Tax=Empedobacter sp. 225-1 TaxID=2746725 RepID=UPI002578DB52|nr:transposase [Empedobacter sp. 225-1]